MIMIQLCSMAFQLAQLSKGEVTMKILHFFILSLFLFSTAGRADIAVVVHPDAKINQLSISQVKRIYLSKMKTFPGTSEEVVPIDQEDTSDVYAEFIKLALRKSESQLASYWSRMMFTGGGTMPKPTENGSEGVKMLVSNNPNLIGYIEKDAVDNRVKVVLWIP